MSRTYYNKLIRDNIPTQIERSGGKYEVRTLNQEGKRAFFHLHIYGRAKEAKYQPYQEAVQLPDRSTGFYDKFKPLTKNDCSKIKKQIELVFKENKYANREWGI